MADGVPAVRLSDVVSRLMRRWQLVVVIALVCTVLAAAFGLLRAPSYTATSVLTVNAITMNPFDEGNTAQDVNITTERAVVQSTEVANAAREKMGSNVDPRDLVERIEVTSPMEAQVIEIAATAGSPAESAAMANAFAEGYLAVRSGAATTERDARIKRIDTRLDQLAGELGTAAAGGDAIQQEMNNLREQRSGLTGATINPGRVITTAAPPREPSSLPLLAYLAGGLAGGLLLGLCTAMVRERFDRRVRSAARLSDIVAAPVLEYGGASSTEELANRLMMRIGLGDNGNPVSVGVLGTDRVSSDGVSVALVEQLLRHWYSAQLVRPLAAAVEQNGELPSAQGRRVSGQDGARIVVFAASVEDGLSRTVMLGQRVNKVIVTVSRSTAIAAVVELLDEMSAAGVDVDAIVVSLRAGDLEPARGHADAGAPPRRDRYAEQPTVRRKPVRS